MDELGGYAFADLRVGMCATFAKTITGSRHRPVCRRVPRQQRHPHQRGVRGRHHFQGLHSHGLLSWRSTGAYQGYRLNPSATGGGLRWGGA